MKNGRKACCVCKVNMGECEGIKEGEVSHGYCPICFKIAMDEIESLKRRNEMKVCTQCAKEIKQEVILNKEIVCKECADKLKLKIERRFPGSDRRSCTLYSLVIPELRIKKRRK